MTEEFRVSDLRVEVARLEGHIAGLERSVTLMEIMLGHLMELLKNEQKFAHVEDWKQICHEIANK